MINYVFYLLKLLDFIHLYKNLRGATATHNFLTLKLKTMKKQKKETLQAIGFLIVLILCMFADNIF